jgi:hypothetical protein
MASRQNRAATLRVNDGNGPADMKLKMIISLRELAEAGRRVIAPASGITVQDISRRITCLVVCLQIPVVAR